MRGRRETIWLRTTATSTLIPQDFTRSGMKNREPRRRRRRRRLGRETKMASSFANGLHDYLTVDVVGDDVDASPG